MSADEKSKALVDLYLEEVTVHSLLVERHSTDFPGAASQVTVWNLKELEKVAPKKKGIGTTLSLTRRTRRAQQCARAFEKKNAKIAKNPFFLFCSMCVLCSATICEGRQSSAH